MNVVLRTIALGVFLSVGVYLAQAEDEPSPAATSPADAMTPQEQAFAELLTGSDLVGSFTVDGKESAPKEDRYSITKAVRIKGNRWAIHARIKYGDVDLTVPVAVEVDWAGKTPVLSVSDLKIPGLGSEFGAALLFQGNRYAGTWQHGQVGGHMWGRIERTPAKSTAP